MLLNIWDQNHSFPPPDIELPMIPKTLKKKLYFNPNCICVIYIDPARDLETLDEELYLSYRSEDDDVVTYGFPQRYPSQSELSTNVCEIEDPDMPMSTAV